MVEHLFWRFGVKQMHLIWHLTFTNYSRIVPNSNEIANSFKNQFNKQIWICFTGILFNE